MSLEEQVEARIRQMQEGSWANMIKKLIEQVESESLEKCEGNKLCKAKILTHLIVVLTQSINGWSKWLNFDSMDNLTDEELDDIYPKLKKLVIAFLELDVEITEKKEREIIEKKKKAMLEYVVKAKEEEGKQRKKRSGAHPEIYVA